jgi:SAM-dependent methyltransferase
VAPPGFLRRWLEHPLTRGRDLDHPGTTALRREIVRGKPFLRRLYLEWYGSIREVLPGGPGAVLELGSGAGMFPDVVPEAITSEVFACPGVRLVADGRALPFAAGALRAVVLVDVLHHVPDCRMFFAEAARCVRPGGVVAAIEPWVTAWSRVVYGRLHHEPFDPERAQWAFPTSGPLSGANGALPWIVLARDRARFEAEFPQWRIREIRPIMPVAYLLSGGVSLRALAPGWAYPLVRGAERIAGPWNDHLAMFARLVLERSGESVG